MKDQFEFLRRNRKVSVRNGWLVLVALLVSLHAGAVELNGVINSHDPATIVEENGRYYHFTTGDGIWYSYSDDLITWTPGPGTVFPVGTWPSWINGEVPGFAGHFWAPGIIHMNGYYYLYYSASTFGSSTSAIGVVRTSSLANPNWQDLGMVVDSNGGSNEINAIDPALFRDDDGKVYMSYGSWFGGIAVVEINTNSGKMIGTPTWLYGGGHQSIEAPYITKEGGYYYLFVNHGNCCQGVNSTYQVHVGRSSNVFGPYSGFNLLLGSSGKYIGPGHVGLVERGDCDYVSVHYYDGNDNGNAKLDILKLTYSNGWPQLTRNFSLTDDCSPACTPSVITPYAQVDGGSWSQTGSAQLDEGQMVKFGPHPTQGGNWSWTGPNAFSATTREITLNNVQANQAGTYTATFLNAAGCESTYDFEVTVEVACQPSGITPYLQIDGGSWSQVGNALLNTGQTVKFGPQPVSGGSWSWSGPNGFAAGTREVTISNIQTSQAGIYSAVYTNAQGCQSNYDFTVSVSGGGSGITNGTYRLTNVGSGMSWDSWGCTGSQGEAVAQANYAGYTCQNWEITNSNGVYSIASTITGNVVDVSGCSPYTGALVQLWSDWGGDCQRFEFTETGDGDGSYYITSVNGGKAVGVPQYSGTGQQAQMQDISGHSWQKWYVVSVSGSRIGQNGDAFDQIGSDLSVFPNPVAENFKLQLSTLKADRAVLELFGMDGKHQLREEFSANDLAQGIVLNRENIEAGVYLIKVSSNQETFTKRIVFK